MENVRIFFVCVIWAIVVIGGICIRSLIMMLYWPARVLMACEYYGGVGGDRLFEIIRGGPFNKLLDDELFCGRRSTQPAKPGMGNPYLPEGWVVPLQFVGGGTATLSIRRNVEAGTVDVDVTNTMISADGPCGDPCVVSPGDTVGFTLDEKRDSAVQPTVAG